MAHYAQITYSNVHSESNQYQTSNLNTFQIDRFISPRRRAHKDALNEKKIHQNGQNSWTSCQKYNLFTT